MANHPVKGTAAAIFKDAGNRLRFLYRQYDAHLIIPLHDAYIFEAPLDVLKSVADLTADVMCKTVQKYFPALESNVEVNIEHPDCWNKDGDANSLERWLKDPFAEIE